MYATEYSRFNISKTKKARKSKLSRYVDYTAEYITPDKFWAQTSSFGKDATPNMGKNAKIPKFPLRNV